MIQSEWQWWQAAVVGVIVLIAIGLAVTPDLNTAAFFAVGVVLGMALMLVSDSEVK